MDLVIFGLPRVIVISEWRFLFTSCQVAMLKTNNKKTFTDLLKPQSIKLYRQIWRHDIAALPVCKWLCILYMQVVQNT